MNEYHLLLQKHDMIKWKQYHHRQRVVSRSKTFMLLFYMWDYPIIDIAVTKYTQKRVDRKKKHRTAQRKSINQTNVMFLSALVPHISSRSSTTSLLGPCNYAKDG